MPQNRSQQPQAASHTLTRPSLPIPDDLCRLLLLWRLQLSRHRGQILRLALCMSTHGSVTGTRQEATGMFRHIRNRGRIGIRWRPGIHGRVHPAVPPRLGSCPPSIIGSLSAFQHKGRYRVKSAKRMIMENTGPQGDVDIPAFQRAMLTYRNTPTPLDNRSPAEILFGRQIRDFVPVMPGKYEPCDTWKDTAANRKKALMERHAKEVEALLPHTRKMPPLKVGNSVRIQNQTGNAPRRWDKSGQVVEVRQNDQYAIKVHGSGRVTLRNRQFLRLYVPHTEKPCPRRITDDIHTRPADIGRLPLSLFPTEDLTREISTPLGSDAQRPPRTPAMLRTPQRTPTHRQGQQLNPHSLNFEPNIEDADTPKTSPRPSAEKTPSRAAPQQTMITSPPSAGLPDTTSRSDRPR